MKFPDGASVYAWFAPTHWERFAGPIDGRVAVRPCPTLQDVATLYHDGATASTASHKETRAATSTAIDTDSCRLISRTDTISAVQKKHEETDRRPLNRAVLGYSVYTAFVLIFVLLILLFILGRWKN